MSPKTIDDGKGNIPVLTERLHDVPLAEWTWEDWEEERTAWNDKIVSILEKARTSAQ
jgi:hypothetical protein